MASLLTFVHYIPNFYLNSITGDCRACVCVCVCVYVCVCVWRRGREWSNKYWLSANVWGASHTRALIHAHTYTSCKQQCTIVNPRPMRHNVNASTIIATKYCNTDTSIHTYIEDRYILHTYIHTYIQKTEHRRNSDLYNST